GFGELAADAAGESVPDTLPLRDGDAGRLIGKSMPRLDGPGKVRGAANFAGDIRLPNMLHAATRQGPVGAIRLVSVNEAAAAQVPGTLHIIKNDRWVAVAANNWWAASQALEAIA